jgi:tight adherence protein C
MQQLDRIMALLVEAFGPLGPAYVLGVFAILLIASVAPILLTRQRDPLDRLGRGSEPGGEPTRARRKEAGPAAGSLRAEEGPGRLDAVAKLFEPQEQEKISSAREMLVQAGYRSRAAVQTYYLARVLGAGLFGALAFAYMFLRDAETDLTTYALAVGGGVLAGYMAPGYWVTRRRQARQEEIGNGFPDALDMMLVCVEAGQSLDQSLMRVADEIAHAHPALSEEFQIVSVEMRAGKERSIVLRDFARRAGVADVSSFVTVLIQSQQFGTSIADALRVYAGEMRDKRIMRAEEKANKLPTKLTLGTMFFTVPPLMLILIGPSLIDIVDALTKMAK